VSDTGGGAGGAPDLILVSDRVITMAGGEQPPAGPGAVAVAAGRVQGVLRRDEVESARGPETEVRDVGARPVLPGFVDVHAHSEVACRAAYGTVDCRAPECGKVDDVLDALRAGLETHDGGWLVGQGNLFFDRKLAEGRLPTREELDRVSRTVPIALRAGGHVTVLNSAALTAAGIDRGYRAPEHSITGKPAVERGDDGEPTGVVKEMDNALPLPAQDRDTVKAALAEGLHRLFTRNGVTTIGEISETVEGIECMDELAREGRLGTRMRVYLWAPGTLSLDAACDWERHIRLSAGTDHVRIQGVKLFADGGYSAASAAVKQPYVHTGGCHCGDIALATEDVEVALRKTRAANLQLAIHANGDRAQEWLCEVVERAGGAPQGRIRTRIEHAGNFMPDPAAARLWKAAGILPVPQPVFLYTFGDYFADYLGEYGTRGRFPFARLLGEGWPLSGSSDVWVGSEREATNPMFGVWCCVARRSYDGNHIDPEQAITVEQALRMHTLDAALALGEEDERGSIEAGKAADLVVLDRDPLGAAEDDLRTIRASEVYLGGREVLGS
jgi:predicted amidohydrolase YtcJ